MTTRSHVTSHVLDATLGRPAQGLSIRLDALHDGTWSTLAEASTDADGRVADLGPAQLGAGVYRVVFDTAAYFGDRPSFYPEVSVAFEVADTTEHYHIPLLLSPFAYSTYRGS
ncbi:5-hydroxyisourate hydrolase [Agromyces flavus]|uniref:5-hydroxyisourate hydrolase n=1 Tax=Agromyces flavus TaxID=589382 RepID=A0A1H1MA80_9MICO|nr:hydroxyisourate hydrolase [Agromyces flavus]MCP2368744.1 5-hydroxyisourate hydrolase [Agromyces flavus]GGI48018.1 5-hydroxyisourate hydrolase [Agromyces flavus]SDR83693.1 5-hydroxyisourate hydrolase [Agromyces flavus]